MHRSLPTIRELIAASAPERQALMDLYATLPAVRCRQRTCCCAMLPEVTLLEALPALGVLMEMPAAPRMGILEKIVTCFLANPVEISSCPFLAGRECLVYRERFLGCRSYGLWSREYYRQIAAQSREAKARLQEQWQQLGVSLPRAVVDFRVPYCEDVEIVDGKTVDDAALIDLAARVENLSARLGPWHELFGQGYFSDLSFWIASMVFGLHGAVRAKFAVVKNIVCDGDRTLLEEKVRDIPDLLAGG